MYKHVKDLNDQFCNLFWHLHKLLRMKDSAYTVNCKFSFMGNGLKANQRTFIFVHVFRPLYGLYTGLYPMTVVCFAKVLARYIIIYRIV